jgi:tetratricopeptide (TPR) repeat protein
MRLTIIAALLLAPAAAFAAGGDDWSAPKPTQTTKECKGAKVWDQKSGKCVDPKKSSLDPDTLFGAVRELAYAGRLAEAQEVLTAMPDQASPRVLTYWGFTHRKLGRLELANQFYEQAIATDPDNLLARSYMGQGFVEEGKLGLALAQWKEIRNRGGTGGWPEVSLRKALETGQTSTY